jgi:dodecin
MSTVAKIIEINSASKKGFEDAVQGGLKKVSKSVKNIKGAWVNDIKVVTDDDGTISEWRVDMRVSFLVS